ncbi:MAG: PorP/SprF family type IX secretion system membrane protein [Saprospiraceae bacterium]|nr:PorP/SprF family type IX secretion system membrane protein [Saprospiraceae bacterium]
MKKLNIISILTGVLLTWMSQSLHAQDHATALKAQSVYNHYYLNLFLLNPAATGMSGQSQLLFNFRNQWSGFEGAPKALTLGIDGSPANNMGLGAMVYNENYGVANRFLGQLNYAYHFKPNEDMKMSLGISGAYIQYNLDNEAITDPNHQNPDPVINRAVNGEKYFAADFGFYSEIKGKYRIGISIPHLVQTKLDDSNITSTSPEEDKPVSFTAFLGGIWRLPEYRVVLEPSLGLRKISDAPFGTDLNILAKLMDERLYAGFTYSFNPSWHRIAMLAGIKLDRLGIFYSYDQSYLEFQNFNNGSHELTLTFGLNKKKEVIEEAVKPAMEPEMPK